MVKLLGKIYGYWLWFAGEAMSPAEVPASGEKYSHKLRRQKQRLGEWWYFLLALVIIVSLVSFINNLRKKRWGKVVLGVLFLLFLAWLVPHIFFVW